MSSFFGRPSESMDGGHSAVFDPLNSQELPEAGVSFLSNVSPESSGQDHEAMREREVTGGRSYASSDLIFISRSGAAGNGPCA